MKNIAKTSLKVGAVAAYITATALFGIRNYHYNNHKTSNESIFEKCEVKPVGLGYAECITAPHGAKTLTIHPLFSKPKTFYDFNGDNKLDASCSIKSVEKSVTGNRYNSHLFDKANKVLALFK